MEVERTVREYRSAHRSVDDACKAYQKDYPEEGMTRALFRKLLDAPSSDSTLRYWQSEMAVAERELSMKINKTRYGGLNEHLEITDKQPALERILFIPDSHIPFEDHEAFELMLRAGNKFKPHRIVILGDFADFFQVSFHPKDQRGKPSFKSEIAAVEHRLDQVDSLGAKSKDFVEGNHCFRLARYLEANRSALVDLEDWSVPKLFHLEERGWTFTKYQESVRIGSLWVTHDVSQSGPTAAAKARDEFGSNAVIGHCHSMQVSYRGTPDNDQLLGASFGWLGRVGDVNYMHRVKSQKWTHGFGIGYHELDTGHVHVQAIPIFGGKCCLNGEIIR